MLMLKLIFLKVYCYFKCNGFIKNYLCVFLILDVVYFYFEK